MITCYGNIHAFDINNNNTDNNDAIQEVGNNMSTILAPIVDAHSKTESQWGKVCNVKFHQAIVTSVTSLLLAGKAAYIIILSSGSDVIVKMWHDSPVGLSNGNNNFRCIMASLELESAVTCMVSLEGYPVFCVGTANGILRFVHVSRKKGSVNLPEKGKGIADVYEV